ncbi:MAG: hypothetical protein ACE5MB_04780 [Anaerolineae bacterium]
MPTNDTVNFYANDPAARGAKRAIQVPVPLPSRPGFDIQGWMGTGGLHHPGTPEFDAGQLYVALTRTVKVWEAFFARDFDVWQVTGGSLQVIPRAGQDLNAYYDRQSLRFFYDANPRTGETVYTCESLEVAAHETGHAILDEYHPEYWDSLLPETAAFHEAFSDCSAILTTLAEPSIRTAMLKQTRGNLSRSNLVSRLAEQMGRALHDTHGREVSYRSSLRNAVNRFKYQRPETLPWRAPISKLSSESHNFSRIFTGAFYDLLAAIYSQLRAGGLDADEALVKARDDAGKLLARGVELAPAGEATFKVIAIAMLKADVQDFNGQYHQALHDIFVKRRILTADEADTVRGLVKPGEMLVRSGGGKGIQPLKPMRRRRGIAELSARRIQSELGLPEEVELKLERSYTRAGKERVIQLTHSREVVLEGPEYGRASGAVVELRGGASVHLTSRGMVTASHYREPEAEEVTSIQDHVKRLVARKRIYFTEPGEPLKIEHLMDVKRPYYTAQDEAGKLRIKRAFIAGAVLLSSMRKQGETLERPLREAD